MDLKIDDMTNKQFIEMTENLIFSCITTKNSKVPYISLQLDEQTPEHCCIHKKATTRKKGVIT